MRSIDQNHQNSPPRRSPRLSKPDEGPSSKNLKYPCTDPAPAPAHKSRKGLQTKPDNSNYEATSSSRVSSGTRSENNYSAPTPIVEQTPASAKDSSHQPETIANRVSSGAATIPKDSREITRDKSEGQLQKPEKKAKHPADVPEITSTLFSFWFTKIFGRERTENRKEDIGYGYFQKLIEKGVKDPLKAFLDMIGIPCPFVIELKEIPPQEEKGNASYKKISTGPEFLMPPTTPPTPPVPFPREGKSPCDLTPDKLKEGYGWIFLDIRGKTIRGSEILGRLVDLNESSSNWGQSALKNIMDKPVFPHELESTEDDDELEVPEGEKGILVDEQTEENGENIGFDHNIRTGYDCLSAWLNNPQLLLPEEWKDMTSDDKKDQLKESIAAMNKLIDASSDDVASAIHYTSRGQSRHQLAQIYDIMDLIPSNKKSILGFTALVSEFIREPKSEPATSEMDAECMFARYSEGLYSSPKWEKGRNQFAWFPAHLRPFGYRTKPDICLRATPVNTGKKLLLPWSKDLLPILFVGECKPKKRYSPERARAQCAAMVQSTLTLLIFFYLDTRGSVSDPPPWWLFIPGIVYTEAGFRIVAHSIKYIVTPTGVPKWTYTSTVLTDAYADVFSARRVDEGTEVPSNSKRRIQALAAFMTLICHASKLYDELSKWERAESVLKIFEEQGIKEREYQTRAKSYIAKNSKGARKGT